MEMIVKLGSWSKNPIVARICAGLEKISNVEKKTTPQRCIIRSGAQTLATLGVDEHVAVVEFRPGGDDYVAAHGSSFIRPHPLQQMARDGWLQARPGNEEEADLVISWISAVAGSE